MATKSKSLTRFLVVLFILLGFIYSYPRLLLANFTKENPWLNYLYMYGFGLVFFSLGIWLILKSKSCQPKRGRDAFWLKALMVGFVYFAGLHGFWIYFALSMPYLGAQ